MIEVGEFAYYSQELIRVSDRSRLIVFARVIDRQAHELHKNQAVEFRVSSNPDNIERNTDMDRCNATAPIPVSTIRSISGCRNLNRSGSGWIRLSSIGLNSCCRDFRR